MNCRDSSQNMKIHIFSKEAVASFIFSCFYWQLAFHDLYNVFCFVKSELKNSVCSFEYSVLKIIIPTNEFHYAN